MSERKFVEYNRKSVEPSNAIGFGAYKDEDGQWKSTGKYNNHIIEFDETTSRLNFKCSKNHDNGQVINNWTTSFYIDQNGYGIPVYGYLNPIVNISVPTTLTEVFNNSIIIGDGENPRLFVPDTSNIPIGFHVYVSKGDITSDYDNFPIIPLGGVKIVAFEYSQPPQNFTVFESGWIHGISVLKWSDLFLIKVLSDTWFLAFGTIGDQDYDE